MRISTNTLFESGSAKLSDLQSSLAKTQQQISTGRRILTPADDPVASARALEITQSQAANAQYGTNRSAAKSTLSQEEVTLQSVTSLLQDIRVQTVNAGNGALDDSQRGYIATQLRSDFGQLLGLANTRDGNGDYLFSGFQSSTLPFTQTPGGATYNGDQGQRLLQVGPARQLAISDSGDDVFMNIKNGNGVFVTAQGTNVATAGPNTGTGTVSLGSVVNMTQLTGHNYTLTFSVVGGTTTYDVTDTTAGATVVTGAPYTSGQSISFDGLQFDIQGAPGDQDTFTIGPSKNQDIFKTLNNLINALSTPASGGQGQTTLTNSLSSAIGNIDHALDHILSVRASVGARLNEIDALDNEGSDRDIQYSQTLSELQDLDYNKTISELTQQQTILSAAQQSFVKITGLSLFNFLN